jgi:hypothetical protein
MFNKLTAFCRFSLTKGQSSLSNGLQRIEVVQINAIQVVKDRIDVTWHRQIDHQERFGQSRFGNCESLAHVHCRCLMAKAKTQYAHSFYPGDSTLGSCAALRPAKCSRSHRRMSTNRRSVYKPPDGGMAKIYWWMFIWALNKIIQERTTMHSQSLKHHHSLRTRVLSTLKKTLSRTFTTASSTSPRRHSAM